MSLILDALNRADSERRSEQLSPSLQAPAAHSGQHGNSRKRLLIEVLLAILIIGYLAVDYFASDNSAASQATQIRVTAPQAAVAVTAPAIAVTAAATRTIAEAGTVTARPVAEAVTVTKPAPAQQAQPHTAAVPANQQRIQSLYQHGDTRPATEPKTLAAAKPKAAEPVTAKTVIEAAAAEKNIPSSAPRATDISELSWNIQQKIPSIDYSNHHYSEQNSQSFVEINQQQYRAGAQLGSGLKLLKIYPEFVLLTFQGTEFKLNALNSWVNFN